LQRKDAMSTAMPRHILVLHDFSDTAQHALSFALDLASKLGAHITVMHAYAIASYAYPEGSLLTAEVADNIEGAALEALEGVAARARRPAVEVQALLRQGRAWNEINSSAEETRADLIVMGTHGRHGVARALLGSVAEKIVRTAPCPVITVHGPDKAS
jgi:nucleotide-binding universal stress UspA family protein